MTGLGTPVRASGRGILRDLNAISSRTRVGLSVTRPRNLSVTLSGSAAPTALCEDCAVRSLYPAA